MERGMSCAFGWDHSVDKYLELYQMARSRKQAAGDV
jgi:glycogen synthase